MLIGYARTSTTDQTAGLEAQLAELVQINVERMFTEQVSAVGERKALEEALDFCREGDTLVVSKLDRLARSVHELGASSGSASAKKRGSADSEPESGYFDTDRQVHGQSSGFDCGVRKADHARKAERRNCSG